MQFLTSNQQIITKFSSEKVSYTQQGETPDCESVPPFPVEPRLFHAYVMIRTAIVRSVVRRMLLSLSLSRLLLLLSRVSDNYVSASD